MVKKIKKSPDKLNDIESGKLKFFLSRCNLLDVLGEKQLSLSWILYLITQKLKNSYSFLANQLCSVIKKPKDVTELLGNLDDFNKEFANELKNVLKRNPPDNVLINNSWKLVIEHVIDKPSELSKQKWENILARIERDEEIKDHLDDIVEYLRPRVVISKPDESKQNAQEIENLIETKFLSQWYVLTNKLMEILTKNTDTDTINELLSKLTVSLRKSLKIAVIAGKELNELYGTADSQIRSIAEHQIDETRIGFYTIARVIADCWEHLMKLDFNRAIEFVEEWRKSEFRLERRLALFASKNKSILEDIVIDQLMSLDVYDFLLASSSVEVFRLIEVRWPDFSQEQRDNIEGRILAFFTPEFTSEKYETNVKFLCFDLLGHMNRINLPLSKKSINFLKEIRDSYPDWELRDIEHAGFQYMYLSKELESNQISAELELRKWYNKCYEYPKKALAELKSKKIPRNTLIYFWSIFLLIAPKVQSQNEIDTILNAVEKFSSGLFSNLRLEISKWLAQSMMNIREEKIWEIFDRIAEKDILVTSLDQTKVGTIQECSTEFLAEILIQLVSQTPSKETVDPRVLDNLETLLERNKEPGHLFKVRLSTFLPRLFERFPDLMRKKIIPLFDWSKDVAKEFWLAQVGNEGLFTQDLFALVKSDFVQIIEQTELENDLFEFFVKQLVEMAISNKLCNIDFDITFPEIRKLLKNSGKKSLPLVAFELLDELHQVKAGDIPAHWTKVVGPVFSGIWPLDTKKQTANANDALIKLICDIKTKTAFLNACSTVSRFIQTSKSQSTMSIRTLADLGSRRVNFAPKQILDLLGCVIGEKPTKQYSELCILLSQIKKGDSRLEDSKEFQRISRLVSNIPH